MSDDVRGGGEEFPPHVIGEYDRRQAWLRDLETTREQQALAHAAVDRHRVGFFDRLTAADARRILAEAYPGPGRYGADDAAVLDATLDLLDHLAGLGDRVTDDYVLADEAEHGGIGNALAVLWAVEECERTGDPSDFLASVYREAIGKRGLTAPQIRGVLNLARAARMRELRAQAEAVPFEEPEVEAANAAERAVYTTVVERLRAIGKRPKLRLPGPDDRAVVLSLAGAVSRKPGAVRVSDDRGYGYSTFYGWIEADGAPDARLRSHPDVCAVLDRLTADPAATLAEYGRATGHCAICGRTLSDPESVARGIGPVCLDRMMGGA